jgi:glycerol-3-phosphate acyltransferase PlsY
MFDLPLPVRLATVTTFGFAVGCLNAGYYLVRARHGADLRAVHSGNAGATNAGRVLGRGGFVLVLLFDAAKGALATAIGLWLADYAGGACGALAAIAGHIWPAQLGFRGGKGIATAVGAFAVLEPATTACTVAFALALFAVTRRWSASGLLAVALSPAFVLVLGRPSRAAGAVLLAVLIVLAAHRDDLRALRSSSPPPADG